MQTERLRDGRWEAGAGPRHTTVQFTPSRPIQSRPTLVPCLHRSLSLPPPPPCTHPHRSLILPSPHPPPLPTGSRIKATRDAATVLSLLGKIESLSIETSRAGELWGWPYLGSTKPGLWPPSRLSVASVQSQRDSTSVSPHPQSSWPGLLHFYWDTFHSEIS